MKFLGFVSVVAIAFMAAAACVGGAGLPSQKDKDGALFKALQENDPAKVKTALAAGADPNAKGLMDATPLWLAAIRNNMEIAKILVAAGAKIDNPVTNNCKDPLLHVAIRNNQTDFARFLIENGADVNARNSRNAVPLHVAACKGNKEIAELLIAKGAELNVQGSFARITPVERARKNRNSEVVAILEKAGAKKWE